ncbi:hypothetical protein [Mesorhizobium sp. M4B.F.Ca.ET.017.02.2.1]|nr:hypothetical protein [Mesorhizobium sp. M4B.F.Ca.ET.017.02.2.1]
MAVPIYIAAIGAAMLASAVWFGRRGDVVRCLACLFMAGCAIVTVLLPIL